MEFAPNLTAYRLSRTISAEDMDAEPLSLRTSNVEIAAPGARGTQMLKAPLAEVPETKRAPMIVDQDASLVETAVDLEEGTKRRNRELHEKLYAIEKRGVHWEEKLHAEMAERDLKHAELLRQFQENLTDASTREEAALMAMIEKFHGEVIPVQEQRMADEEEEVRKFVHETVPAVIDRQSGIIGRKLQKAHDTFDIENAKIMKREQKIVQRFERHVARTAQSFEDERATRRGKFMLLEEDVDEVRGVTSGSMPSRRHRGISIVPC
jgi:hypothetical protein